MLQVANGHGDHEPMPVGYRIGLGAALGVAIAGAVYLLAVRGPALLIDISHLAGQMLCL